MCFFVAKWIYVLLLLLRLVLLFSFHALCRSSLSTPCAGVYSFLRSCVLFFAHTGVFSLPLVFSRVFLLYSFCSLVSCYSAAVCIWLCSMCVFFLCGFAVQIPSVGFKQPYSGYFSRFVWNFVIFFAYIAIWYEFWLWVFSFFSVALPIHLYDVLFIFFSPFHLSFVVYYFDILELFHSFPYIFDASSIIAWFFVVYSICFYFFFSSRAHTCRLIIIQLIVSLFVSFFLF